MAHLSHIGNSLGVRIPKAIIHQVGFTEETTLAFKVTEEGLLLSPVRLAREGWSEAFKSTSCRKKEPLLVSDVLENTFDKDEWEW